MAKRISWLADVNRHDVADVGGKNSSLGEMLGQLQQLGIKVPNGFATTSHAFREFIQENQIGEKISGLLADLDTNDVKALAAVGKQVRDLVNNAQLSAEFTAEIKQAYQELSASNPEFAVAVRSSATAEDLANASFAGQQETFLNVRGFDDVLKTIKEVYASLFNDRAIAYRVHQGFAHDDVAISVGVQQMVRSDIASSGVMFTIDTESGFDDVVFITASYGLGELVVQGGVNPDEFYAYKPNLAAQRPAILKRHLGSKKQKIVYAEANDADEFIKTVPVAEEQQTKFCITDDDVEKLAHHAVALEKHYGHSLDIEWAKDGLTGELFIVQARPETVQSQNKGKIQEVFKLNEKSDIKVTGRSVGQKIGKGRARLIKNLSAMDEMQDGDVLVTDMTDPNWEPIMQRASAIVTNRGGRTCHAAIIARELGIPAVVGCGNATTAISDGESVTVSCSEGETGHIYAGLLDFSIERRDVGNIPDLPTKIMLNLANPDLAFSHRNIPNSGVGLARLEFIINHFIGIHPKALLDFDKLTDKKLKQQIHEKIACYDSPTDYFVKKMQEGIAMIAAAFHPKPIIVRCSDFKSNEYAHLLGGHLYEPNEENPMLGYRGAARYISDDFRKCFELECQALKMVRDDMGLTNVQVMIPFVRTLNEANQVMQLLKANGLERGVNDLKVIMMCELPSNAVLAEEFLEYFDGFSIGSNDLTQLTLGIDRDSALVAQEFDERNPAIKKLLHNAISACLAANKYVGICGQGPSDHKDFAKWLVEEGISSVSLNPDTVLETSLYLAKLHNKEKC